MEFDRRQTNIAKGIAVLLLLWHHLFFNNPEKYSDFVSLLYLGSTPIECFFADFCKVCVAVFVVLSGYGLYKSFEKYERTNAVNGKLSIKKQIVFVKNHLVKLMFGYWFIYLIFVPMGICLNRPFWAFYGDNPFYYIADFLGLAHLFGTPTMNATWWYMSIAVVFYLFLPVIYKILNYVPELLLLISFAVVILPIPFTFVNYKLWLFPFILGMYFAKNNLFVRADKRLNTMVEKIMVCLILLICITFLRYTVFRMNAELDGFFAIAVILTGYLLISKVPILNKILEELGKYSAQIFMFHTFIFSYYFKDLIYGCKYSLVIFVVLTVVCYIIAILLEWLKHIVRYDKLLYKLIR